MNISRTHTWVAGIGITLLLLALLVGLPLAARAQGPAPQGTAAALGTAFTYQGRLTKNNAAVNGTCDFRFSLWDAASGGSQVGSTVPKSNVSVQNGLFSVDLDFGDSAFTGDARYLQVEVKCSGETSYTNLGRVALNGTPYALGFRPGARVEATYDNGAILELINNSTSTLGGGLYAESSGPTAPAVYGYHTGDGHALYGRTSGNYPAIEGVNNGAGEGVVGRTNDVNSAAVYGYNGSTGGKGVYGYSDGGVGVEGRGGTIGYIGVLGSAASYGGYFTATVGYGLYAQGPMGAARLNGDVYVGGLLTWKPITSYLSIPAAAFVPQYNYNAQTYNGGSIVRTLSGSYNIFNAPVQLPHGATVTKMTVYWYDDYAGDDGTITLRRSSLSSIFTNEMAKVTTSGSGGNGNGEDTTINYAQIDNSQYTYYLTAQLPTDGTNYVGLYGVIIEYTIDRPY